MYDLNDTIVAVSSTSAGARSIVRITGPETIDVCGRIFGPQITNGKRGQTRVIAGSISIDAELRVDANLYLFFAPHTYTGEDVAEIHIHINSAVTEALMENLLGKGIGGGLRMAGPGEFTARAYLNGKIDLAQAEAVNEIIVSSNRFQLAAAEKLLSGRLSETTAKVRSAMMDCLSLIEAGLDFSDEDIELGPHFANKRQNGNPFITRPEAVERLSRIEEQLEELLSGSISYESVIDLPAVGVAGAPNAGKSRLVNKLLGTERSIVSHRRKTTRDVLTGLLTLAHNRCVLFDCAGLISEPDNILDELAQQAAIEALRNSSVVVFCVDVSKADWPEDISIFRSQMSENRSQKKNVPPSVLPARGPWGCPCPKASAVRRPADCGLSSKLIPVATKCDLLSEGALAERLTELNGLFGAKFLATSAKSGTGIGLLRETIDKKIVELSSGSAAAQSRALPFSEGPENAQSAIALTARHKQAVTEAIENIRESIKELEAGNDEGCPEVAAMMLRAAYQGICDIEQQHIDEQILDRIFSRFCIGK